MVIENESNAVRQARSPLAALKRGLLGLLGRTPRRRVPATLYTRPGCQLCEQLERRLLSARVGVLFELERVDIDADSELTRRYGDKIPVLMVGGRLAFAGVVREGSFEPRLRKLAWRYLEEC